MAQFATQRNHPRLLTIKNHMLQCRNKHSFSQILNIVRPTNFNILF